MVSSGKEYDVVIAGAGPAGLTLAWKVAEQGHSVLVLDAKKSASDVRYLTLASFIDLDKFELSERIAQPINEIYFGSTSVETRRRDSSGSLRTWSIDRRKMLKELEQKAKRSGAKILYKSPVKNVQLKNGQVITITIPAKGSSRTVRGKIYADCSGMGRVFERHLPVVPKGRVKTFVGIEYVLPLRKGPNTVDIYVGKSCQHGYGWLFPLNSSEAILGYGTVKKLSSAKLRNRIDALLTLPRVRKRVKPDVKLCHSGVFRTGLPLRSFTHGNVVYVGDVALQGNPVLGEGVRFVMDSAEMAASAVDRALRLQNKKHLREYSTAWVSKYYHQHMAGYIAQHLGLLFLRSDRFSDEFVRALGKISERSVFLMMSGEMDYRFVWRAFKRAMGVSLSFHLFK